ncbi:30S ribosome-binding factor RbfA [Aminipila terrae]|uniref:Ribosome-binding factor A n=1 Tax=Aminipila terrae TaxID=2697030 RepID=A0A6P1MHM8_9FIRM|nr:30S ribosome-binding factor RbfA [Aminipila terrae]QHI73241.1 30S ribosome-binding factor RbfA [Aminipila terrae]
MGKGYRQGRLGEEIRKLIGELLLREIKDPRLSGLVSISAVEVTSDGSYATIYVTVLGSSKDEEKAKKEKEEVLAAFKSAKGLIKREIGKSIKLRHVPDLIFKMDESMEYGRHISEIISSLGIENYKEEPDEEDE